MNKLLTLTIIITYLLQSAGTSFALRPASSRSSDPREAGLSAAIKQAGTTSLKSSSSGDSVQRRQTLETAKAELATAVSLIFRRSGDGEDGEVVIRGFEDGVQYTDSVKKAVEGFVRTGSLDDIDEVIAFYNQVIEPILAKMVTGSKDIIRCTIYALFVDTFVAEVYRIDTMAASGSLVQRRTALLEKATEVAQSAMELFKHLSVAESFTRRLASIQELMEVGDLSTQSILDELLAIKSFNEKPQVAVRLSLAYKRSGEPLKMRLINEFLSNALQPNTPEWISALALYAHSFLETVSYNKRLVLDLIAKVEKCLEYYSSHDDADDREHSISFLSMVQARLYMILGEREDLERAFTLSCRASDTESNNRVFALNVEYAARKMLAAAIASDDPDRAAQLIEEAPAHFPNCMEHGPSGQTLLAQDLAGISTRFKDLTIMSFPGREVVGLATEWEQLLADASRLDLEIVPRVLFDYLNLLDRLGSSGPESMPQEEIDRKKSEALVVFADYIGRTVTAVGRRQWNFFVSTLPSMPDQVSALDSIDAVIMPKDIKLADFAEAWSRFTPDQIAEMVDFDILLSDVRVEKYFKELSSRIQGSLEHITDEQAKALWPYLRAVFSLTVERDSFTTRSFIRELIGESDNIWLNEQLDNFLRNEACVSNMSIDELVVFTDLQRKAHSGWALALLDRSLKAVLDLHYTRSGDDIASLFDTAEHFRQRLIKDIGYQGNLFMYFSMISLIFEYATYFTERERDAEFRRKLEDSLSALEARIDNIVGAMREHTPNELIGCYHLLGCAAHRAGNDELAAKLFGRLTKWIKDPNEILVEFRGSLSFFARFGVSLEASGDTHGARRVFEQWADSVNLLTSNTSRSQTIKTRWAENTGTDEKSSSSGKKKVTMPDKAVYARIISSICNVEPEALAKMAGISDKVRQSIATCIRGWLENDWEDLDREYGVSLAFLAYYVLDDAEIFKEAMQKISGFAEDLYIDTLPYIMQAGYCYGYLGSLHAANQDASSAEAAFRIAATRAEEVRERGSYSSEVNSFLSASLLLFQGQTEEAIRVIEQARRELDEDSDYSGFPIECFLAACYAIFGEEGRARAQVTEALKAEIAKVSVSDERKARMRALGGRFNSSVFLRPLYLKFPDQVFNLFSQFIFDETLSSNEREVLIRTLDVLDAERLIRLIINHFLSLLGTFEQGAQQRLPNEDLQLQLLGYLVGTDTRYKVVIRLLVSEILANTELTESALERTAGYLRIMKAWHIEAADHLIAAEGLHQRGKTTEALEEVRHGIKLTRRIGEGHMAAPLTALKAKIEEEVGQLETLYAEGRFHEALAICE